MKKELWHLLIEGRHGRHGVDAVRNLGDAEIKKLHSLAQGFYHYHYRPADSLNRADFLALRQGEKFKLTERWGKKCSAQAIPPC
jgi:hypothetical protein